VVRRSRILAALTVGMVIASPAAAENMLTMPLQCAVQAGRVVLSPHAGERHYKIVGAHESHPFTACAPNAPDLCRTWQVHKFDIQCDGGRVPWINVVSAFLEATPRRAWVENGRVHFRMGARWNGPAYDGACDARINGGSPSAECRRSSGSADGPVIALPAGFAPMLSTGGRFAPSAPPAIAAPESPRDMKSPAVMSAPKAVADAGPKAREPMAFRPTPLISNAPAPSSAETGGWLTTTEASVGAEMIDREAAERKRLLVLAMIAVLIATTTCALLLRHRRVAEALARGARANILTLLQRVHSRQWPGFTRRSAAPPSSEGDAVAAMIAAAVETHRSVADAVSGLNAEPLREVLIADLALARATLLAPQLTEAVASAHWPEVRATVSTVVADLERSRRIAMSAAQLESDLRTDDSMPSNLAEAFAIIGVTAEAGSVLTKKIVDALRQSWHPDLARNDQDRQAREIRIRQINVAWDLIAGRQKAA
jgi:hypothetical protein